MNEARFSFGDVAPRMRAHPPRTPKLWLRDDEVDLWRVALDGLQPESVAYLESLLSPDETQRVRRFFFERDRRRAVVARGILRVLLAAYTGRPASSLRFAYGANGKPSLPTEASEKPIRFNVAHSEDLALYAFTPAGELGIDVERIRELPEWEGIAASCFSAAEAERVRRCPSNGRAEEFLRAWTRHEAVLKAFGIGLTGDSAILGLHEQASGACDDAPAGYRVCGLNVAPQYAAALAAPASIRQATCRTWPVGAGADESYHALPARRMPLDQLTVSELSFP